MTLRILPNDICTRLGRALIKGGSGDYEVLEFLAASGFVESWTRYDPWLRKDVTHDNVNVEAALNQGFELREDY